MKLSFLALAASVTATFTPGGKMPKTGNRIHNMMYWEKKVAENNGPTGPAYGASGDLLSAEMWGMEDLSTGRPMAHQGHRDETNFYYHMPEGLGMDGSSHGLSEVEWIRVIYMPWLAAAPASGQPRGTINGTVVYGLDDCNEAGRALYYASQDGSDAAEIETLTADCEAKCILFSVETDWTNARNCSDPAGALPIGHPGSGHQWLQAMYDFEAAVASQKANGEEPDTIYDFVPPHVVGSKIMPVEEQAEVNMTQIDNNAELMAEQQAHIEALYNNRTDNMTITVGGEEQTLETMCRRLRSAGVEVNCGDDDGTSGNGTDVVVEPAPVVGNTTATDTETEESGSLINNVSLALLAFSIAIFK